MTDSSSDVDMVISEKAMKDIMSAGSDSPKSNMTHLLRLGSFQMEIVPSKDINIEEVFKNTIADLHEKFGPEVLKINTADIIAKKDQMGGMHG